jgi:hypothetical protein
MKVQVQAGPFNSFQNGKSSVLKKSFTRTILGVNDESVNTICTMLKQSNTNYVFLRVYKQRLVL